MVTPYLTVSVCCNVDCQFLFICKRDISYKFILKPSALLAWYSIIVSKMNAGSIVCFFPLFGATLNRIFLFGVFYFNANASFFSV